MIKLVLTVVFLLAGQPVSQQRLNFGTVFPTTQSCEAERADQLAKYAVSEGPLASVADVIKERGFPDLTPAPADGFKFELTCEDWSK